MDRLVWTDKIPTAEGAYWARSTDDPDSSAEVTNVYRDGHGDLAFFLGDFGPYPITLNDREWAGPLPLPLEPGQCEHGVNDDTFCGPCEDAWKRRAIINGDMPARGYFESPDEA